MELHTIGIFTAVVAVRTLLNLKTMKYIKNVVNIFWHNLLGGFFFWFVSTHPPQLPIPNFKLSHKTKINYFLNIIHLSLTMHAILLAQNMSGHNF